jgi:nitrite reductase/ring-hydroxylating ferredoxin subunit
LPAELYTRPEAFQQERRRVFGDAWLLLGRTDILAKPGDYVAQSLGGWPLFAIADPEGSARAFRNVCRHQKLPLLDSGVGHCTQIRCRYHGWTYETTGRFLTAPPPVAPSGELSPALEPVMAEALHGLLFVHLDHDPPALVDALPALAAALRGPTLQACRFQAETGTDIDANWKLVMEQILSERPSDIERTVAWPSLVLETRGNGTVLHQVIARSFHRTRIHHHQYGAIVVEEVAARVAQWKAGAVARQAALEAGGALAVPGSPELEDFRRRVRTAHAEGPRP